MAKKRIPEVTRDGSEVDFIPQNFMLIDGAEGSAKMRMDLFAKASSVESLRTDVSGKADKVTGATEGDVATLDANGNLVDSGKAVSDFAASPHTHTVKINGATKTISATGGAAVDLGTYLTSHQAVSDSNPTLAWGTTSTVGTVGGKALRVTMPSNPAGGMAEDFFALVTQSTFEDVKTAYNAGKRIVGVIGGTASGGNMFRQETPLAFVFFRDNEPFSFVFLFENARPKTESGDGVGSTNRWTLSSSGWATSTDNVDYAETAGTAYMAAKLNPGSAGDKEHPCFFAGGIPYECYGSSTYSLFKGTLNATAWASISGTVSPTGNIRTQYIVTDTSVIDLRKTGGTEGNTGCMQIRVKGDGNACRTLTVQYLDTFGNTRSFEIYWGNSSHFTRVNEFVVFWAESRFSNNQSVNRHCTIVPVRLPDLSSWDGESV